MSTGAWDDLLSMMEEPDFKETFQKAAEKYPEIKNSVLRQADYSRKSNERDAKVKLADRWDQWRQENWDDTANMTKAEAEAAAKNRELEVELEILRQRTETDVTLEEVNEQVERLLEKKTKGVLTEEQFAQKYGNKLFNKDAYDKEVETRFNSGMAGVETIFRKTLPAVLKHKDEFHEVIDPLTIVEYANKNGVPDLDRAYELMVSPRREEARKKEYDTKLAEAEKRGEDKARKEVAMGQGGKMPTDTGAPAMTHLQERVTRKAQDAPAIPPEIKADGSGALGMKVAEIYRQDKASAA